MGSGMKKELSNAELKKLISDGKINWRKPISCHLYPIKPKKTNTHELLNYEPREKLCHPGCVLGEKLKVPVYQFLKDALIRKYGEEFYHASRCCSKTAQGIKRKYKFVNIFL